MKKSFVIFSILFLISPYVVAKNCTTGKPCGNTCININYVCHVGSTTSTTGSISPTCIAPQVLQNNVCVTPVPTCIAPQVLQNNVCVTPIPTCIAPQVLQNNVCVTPVPTCIAPQVLQNNICVTPVPTCVAPQVLQNNVCVTPTLTCTISTLAASQSDRVFAYLEATYPEYLSPAGSASSTAGCYYYRYYSTTNSYIATSGETVYYLGSTSKNQIIPLGKLSDWLATAIAAGY